MNVNKVILVGRAGKDPEARETGKGEAVANISLATNSGYGDNEKTDWHRVTFFGKLANTVIEYVRKVRNFTLKGEYPTASTLAKTVLRSTAPISLLTRCRWARRKVVQQFLQRARMTTRYHSREDGGGNTPSLYWQEDVDQTFRVYHLARKIYPKRWDVTSKGDSWDRWFFKTPE